MFDYLRLLLKAMKIPLSLMNGQLVAYDTQLCNSKLNFSLWGFPSGAVVKNPPANAGNMGSSPGLGRSHML